MMIMKVTLEQIEKFEAFLVTNSTMMYTIDEIVEGTGIPAPIIQLAMDWYIMEIAEQNDEVYYSLEYTMPKEIVTLFMTCPVCKGDTEITQRIKTIHCPHCRLYLSIAMRYALMRKCFCVIVFGKPKRQRWVWIGNHTWQCSNCGETKVWRSRREETDHVGLYVVGDCNNTLAIAKLPNAEQMKKYKRLLASGELYAEWK